MQENSRVNQTNDINTGGNSYQPLPETLQNTAYTPAFLRRYIGKLVRVEFLIGTTYLEDRSGILLEVGASYIVLRAIQDRNLLYCDIFSIKFVTISEEPYMFNPEFQV